MKKEEAIKKYEDKLKTYKENLNIAETTSVLLGKPIDENHKANCITMYQNLIKLVEQVVNDFKQIDEQKWHKISEEGLPKEEGEYLCAIHTSYAEEDEDEYIYGAYWWGLNDWFGYPIGEIIAWQKITPYEG